VRTPFGPVKKATLPLNRTGEGFIPLLDYIKQSNLCTKGVIVYDRLVGNAPALLLKKASCIEVHRLVSSQLAAQTLKQLGTSYFSLATVPYISNRAGNAVCPFEKVSNWEIH